AESKDGGRRMKAYHSDAEQHTRNPTAEDDAPLCYRNAEGYPDPTAYHALRSAMKKPQPAKKDRPLRTQVVHYD
ncbi:MAG: hypothetical protein SPH82_05855, partial [Eubacteriales bacterium]|nr:hypothetical protein [Eubacteriales bacterium]